MCDYVFRILIVGDMGVGKSSIFERFVQDHFSVDYNSTVGVDFNVSQTKVAGKRVLLQIWDASGEVRFRAMLQNYYRNSHGIIIVYDTTSLSSFHNVNYWLKELDVILSDGVNVILVGTKSDELEKRQVSHEEAAQYAEHYGLSFIEVSAKSGANVKDAFETLAVEVYNRLVPKVMTSPSPSTQSKKMAKGQVQAGEDQGDGEGDGKAEGEGMGDVPLQDETTILLEDKKTPKN